MSGMIQKKLVKSAALRRAIKWEDVRGGRLTFTVFLFAPSEFYAITYVCYLK